MVKNYEIQSYFYITSYFSFWKLQQRILASITVCGFLFSPSTCRLLFFALVGLFVLLTTELYSTVRYNFFTERVIGTWNNLPSTVNFATLATFRQTIADVDLSNYIKSTIVYFILCDGRVSVPVDVDLSVQFTTCVFMFCLIVLLFEQIKMYVCNYSESCQSNSINIQKR